MNLSVKQRLILLTILPKESNFATLKILRKLKEDLSFSEEEHAKLQFRTIPDAQGSASTNWSDDGDKEIGEVDIPIGEKATDIVVEALKGLDKAKKLTEQHVSLYEKFVGDKEE